MSVMVYLEPFCMSAVVMHIIAVCLQMNKVEYYYCFYHIPCPVWHRAYGVLEITGVRERYFEMSDICFCQSDVDTC